MTRQDRSGAELKPRLSADSLENMSREAEATPGLQQLAWVLAIQLQVLNRADDLRMHISTHTEYTCPVWRGGERGGGEGLGSTRRGRKNIHKGRKERN